MLALAADENLNNNIVRGVIRRLPEINFVTVQEAGLGGADDPTVLDGRQPQAAFCSRTTLQR